MRTCLNIPLGMCMYLFMRVLLHDVVCAYLSCPGPEYLCRGVVARMLSGKDPCPGSISVMAFDMKSRYVISSVILYRQSIEQTFATLTGE